MVYRLITYCLSILLKEYLASKRLEIIQYLKQKGIGAGVYYLKPVPHLNFYKNKYGYDGNCFPVTSCIGRSSIGLLVGHHLNMEDKEYMVKSVRKTFEGVVK